MVYTIEKLETKSIPLINESHDSNISNEAALIMPVIAMYDSFVPWLSPQITEHSNELQDHPQPRENSWWFSRWLSNKREQWHGNRPHVSENDERSQDDDVPCFLDSTDPLDENQYREASLRFPPQAHSLARFHLSGIQTKRHVLNFGRVSHLYFNGKLSCAADKGNQESPPFISSCASRKIGTLIDFFQPTSDLSPSKLRDMTLIQVMDTSDKDILVQEMARQLAPTNMGGGETGTRLLSRKAFLNPRLPCHPSHFRVAAIGNHCRCVSWGLENGSVTVYKRVNDMWTATAVITPASQEYGRIELGSDISANTSGSNVLQCPSLNLVSDIVPLIVPTYNGASSVALIILSRIGGCIEIHPLHDSIWKCMGREDFNATTKGRLYQQKRPDNMRLSSDSGVIVDARKYQNDIICLDVQRRDLPFTSPPSIYGNHPPICFTIAASGTLTCDSSTDQALSHPVISLWSVEMIMSQQQNESGNVSSIQYQILRVLSPSNQQLCLPSSLLRKCRVVADTFLLKRYLSHFTTRNDNNNRKHQCIEPIIEFTAPYVQLQVTSSLHHKSSDHYNGDELLVSALDYYGSISLFYFNHQSKSLDLFEVISKGSLLSHSSLAQFQWLSDLPGKKESHKNKNFLFLAGVTQSGLLTIAKLETDKFSNFSSTNRRLRIVFLEEKNSHPINNYTFLCQPPGTNAFCNKGFSFVRCLRSKDFHNFNDTRVDTIQKESLLCSVCYVQNIHPLTLAKQMEVADNNYGAIALLKSFSTSTDPELGTDSFYKALWEALTQPISIESLTVDDVQRCLRSIQDDDYVIHASTLEYSNLSNPITLRLILGEGLGRLMKMRKVVPLEKKKDGRFGDDQHRSEILDLLEERIICLGTYEWLCRHLCVGFQSTVFFSQFIKANKLVIAKEFALKGDIDALFIVLLRHGSETLPCRLQLLSYLPPTVCPASYSHLLPAIPVTRSSIECAFKENAHYFLLEPNAEPVDLRHLILHFDCLFPNSKIDVSDIASLERSHRFTQVGDGAIDSEVLASWYIAQVLALEKNGGCLKHTIELCQLGIERLPRQERKDKKTSDLESLLASLLHFDFCCSYGAIPETMTFSGWCSLEVASAILLILGDDSEPDLALSRWELCIAPMITLCKNDNFQREWGWRLSSNLAKIQEEAEQAVATYIFYRCKQDFLRGLSLCLLFASHSKATLRRSSRIIHSGKVLTKCVMDCLYYCQYFFTADNVKQVINVFWDIYETLPAKDVPEDPNSSQNVLHNQIDILERHLIATDISSNYFAPFPLYCFLSCENNLGGLILKKMCISMRDRAFQHEVSEERSREWKEISYRFAIDVTELQNRVLIKLDTSSIIEEHLLNLLIDDHKILALKELYLALIKFQEFSHFPFKLENEVKCLIKTGEIEIAEEIAKYFSSLFPEINEDIERMKSLREALLVIVEVLGCISITYDSLENQPPFDVLGLVLTQNPLAIVFGSEWSDQEYSKEQNHKLWNEFLGGSSFSGIILPGQFVHRVAMLLGLSTEVDEFCVNQLMIFFGIQSGLYGAAASLYINSLRYAHSLCIFSSSELDLSATALHNAVLLVSANDYSDCYIRKELCVHSLTNIMSKENVIASFETGQCFKTLIEQYSLLDANQTHFKRLEVSNEHRGSNLQQHTGGEFLVFKAVEIIAEGAKNVIGQKNMETKNIHHQLLVDGLALNASFLLHPLVDELILDQEEFKELFARLRLALNSAFYGKTMSSETELIVKSSLSVIGRRIFSLCISEAAKFRDRQEWETMPYSSSIQINDLVQLAVSMLLESISRSGSKQVVTQLNGQFEDEVSIAMNRAVNFDGNDTPDKEIVKRLRHYGYSLNGACRATLATRSSNFEAALSYAISHCQEKDFNSPLPNLNKHPVHKPTSFFVDQIVVHKVANSLQFLMYMDAQVESVLDYSGFFSKLHSVLRGKNSSNETNTPIVDDSAPQLPPAGEIETDHGTKITDHGLAIKKDLKTVSGSKRSKKPPQTYQNSIGKEKQQMTSLVKPKLIARACVDTILNSDVTTKMLGVEEKRRLAEQGRRLLEASRKAKICSQSSDINLSKNNQIQQSTGHQSSLQATSACGDGHTDMKKTQESLVMQESSKGEHQEGWDFEDDW